MRKRHMKKCDDKWGNKTSLTEDYSAKLIENGRLESLDAENRMKTSLGGFWEILKA